MGIKQLIETNMIKSSFAVARVMVLDKFTLFTFFDLCLAHEKMCNVLIVWFLLHDAYGTTLTVQNWQLNLQVCCLWHN